MSGYDWNIFVTNDLEYSFDDKADAVQQIRDDIKEHGEEYVRRQYELQVYYDVPELNTTKTRTLVGQEIIDWVCDRGD
jgi:hypothetical protein